MKLTCLLIDQGTRGLSELTNTRGNLEPQKGNLHIPDSGFSSVVSIRSDGSTPDVTQSDPSDSQNDIRKSVLTSVIGTFCTCNITSINIVIILSSVYLVQYNKYNLMIKHNNWKMGGGGGGG